MSTYEQSAKGSGLSDQEEAIRRYADRRSRDLISIFGDKASGMGPGKAKANFELRDAIAQAKELGAVLIVNEISRLGRNEDLAGLLRSEGVRVISIREGGLVGARQLKRLLREAKEEGEAIGRTVLHGLARARSRGLKLGNPEILHRKRPRANIARRSQKDALTEEIAEILRKIDPLGTFTHRQLADELNKRNLRTSQGNPWTESRVERHHRSAKNLLASEAAWTEEVVIATEPAPVGDIGKS